MRLEIRLTSNCNFDCEYCSSLHNNKSKANQFNSIGFRNVLSQFLNPDVFIYGGEPTTHRDFLGLIAQIKEESPGSQIIVQTNLSKPELLMDSSIQVQASFHSSQLEFSLFLKNLDLIKEYNNLGEISFMDASDSDYKYYRILKRLYPDKVQFCPVIDSDITKQSSSKRIQALSDKDIYKEIQDDWHFIKHGSGLSNYDYWKEDMNLSFGKQCEIEFNSIYLDEKYVYPCFNGIFFEPQNRTLFEDFKYSPKEVSCPYERCFFDMQSWVENKKEINDTNRR